MKLILAARLGRVDEVRRILDGGASLAETDRDGNNALHLASRGRAARRTGRGHRDATARGSGDDAAATPPRAGASTATRPSSRSSWTEARIRTVRARAAGRRCTLAARRRFL